MASKIPPALPEGPGVAVSLSIRQRILRIALACLAIVVSGAAVNYATASRSLLTFGHAGLAGVQPIIDEIARADDEQQLVFVGTSQFLHGINPVAMDAALAEVGCAVDVYVLAFPSLSWTEERQLVSALLSEANPDLVVLPASISTVNPRTNPYSPALFSLVELFQFDVLRSGRSRTEKIRILRKRLRAIALGALGYRRLGFLWTGHYENLIRSPRGYLPFPEDHNQYTDQVARLLHERDLPAERVHDSGPSEIGDAVARRNGRRALAAQDAAPVLFIGMPEAFRSTSENLIPSGLVRISAETSSVGLNDVRIVPELAEVSFWQDSTHISNLGARQLASRAAPYICDMIRGRQ